MFTGLIEEVGEVRRLTRATVVKLSIASSRMIEDVTVGDSVAVSGVCLTAVSLKGGEIAFDVVPETLARSTLIDLRPGDKVNLEASLRAGKMIGGHFVQGHVDGIGALESISSLAESRLFSVKAPPEVMRYVVEKGSIALDGISLTVARCDERSFTIAVIPHTLAGTTLGLKKTGDRVNLETDIIGKYVEKFLTARSSGSSGVTEDLLRQSGFMT